MVNLVRFFNTLNFDTALGAISFAFIISYSKKAEIDLIIYFALFISVLSIYNIDHLIDASKLQDGAKSNRHSFYQKHRNALIVWQIFLSGLGLATLFYLPTQILIGGVGLLVCIGIYFGIIFSFTQTSWVLREIVIAFGYTLAVALLPIFEFNLNLNLNFFWLFSIIFLIALANLWLFSLFDIEVDKSQNHHSITSAVKPLQLKKLIKFTVLLAIVLIVGYAIYFNSYILGSALIFTALTYFLLLQKHSFFVRNEYYRLVGEAVLILPGLVLFVTNAI